MDMREMVDKVKKGEPLYGHSTLSPYMQGVAARNSRYAGLFIHVVPWANFVNHNQVRECMARGEICILQSIELWLMLFAGSMVWILRSTINKRRGSWPRKTLKKHRLSFRYQIDLLALGPIMAYCV